ncbi:MAG: TPM domain-containing protein, partial [Sphingobacteriales bacterium]
MKLYIFIVLLAILGCAQNVSIQDKERVVDAGYFFQLSEKNELELKIDKLEREHGIKLFIYTVISENYYSQKDYSNAVFNFLQARTEGSKSPILLIYLSYEERAIKIKVNSSGAKKFNDSVCHLLVGTIEKFF